MSYVESENRGESPKLEYMSPSDSIIAEGLTAPPWNTLEDETLLKQIGVHGVKAWSTISCALPNRTGKACKDRWMAHVGPKLKLAQWSDQENSILLVARQEYGEAWDVIAKALPKHSEASCMIHWEELVRSKDLSQRVDDALGAANVARSPKRPRSPRNCDSYYASEGVGLPAVSAEIIEGGLEGLNISIPLEAGDDGEIDDFRMSNIFGPPRPGTFSISLDSGRSSPTQECPDKSPPPILQLPTGDIIGDGTFCPADEEFLQARPKVTLKSIDEQVADDPRFRALFPPGDEINRNISSLTIDMNLILASAASAQSRIEVSPLSTNLTATPTAFSFHDGQRVPNLATILETHRACRKQTKKTDGVATPSAANGLAYCGPPPRSEGGNSKSLRMRAPIHIGNEERGLFHRQLLHKLFVADANGPVEPQTQTKARPKSRERKQR